MSRWRFVPVIAAVSACAAAPKPAEPGREARCEPPVTDATIEEAVFTDATAEDASVEIEPPEDVVVTLEAPYPPGARPRPRTAVAASADDEIVARYNRGSGPATPDRPAHPAPRIRIDVVRTGSKTKSAELLRVARAKGYWPVRLCYEEGLRTSQRMHATLRFSIRVASSGAVRETRTMHAGAAEKDVAVCVAKAIRKLSLAGPPRGTSTAVLEVSLWPGDTPVHVPTAVEPLPWSAGELDAVLGTRSSDIRRCYLDGLRRDAGLWGRIAMEAEIAADGSVTRVHESESRFPDPDVAACVASAVKSIVLRPSGRTVEVVFAARLGGLTTEGDAG
jgi:hypothetical protein